MKSYRNQPAGTVPRARGLRRASTDAERMLWHEVRERLPMWKWRRQVPIGPYFADLLCFEAKLIVELDGGQHASDVAYDARRTHLLEGLGYRVVRVWNHDVSENIDGVLSIISQSLSYQEREGPARRSRVGG